MMCVIGCPVGCVEGVFNCHLFPLFLFCFLAVFALWLLLMFSMLCDDDALCV